MLKFVDFVPRQLKAPRFGLTPGAIQGEYESLENALEAANTWLTRSGSRVVNVETVVLPNLGANWEEGSRDPVLGNAQGGELWHQFIRIWYEDASMPDNDQANGAG